MKESPKLAQVTPNPWCEEELRLWGATGRQEVEPGRFPDNSCEGDPRRRSSPLPTRHKGKRKKSIATVKRKAKLHTCYPTARDTFSCTDEKNKSIARQYLKICQTPSSNN
ncbi:unnamed protein product [Leuciscus chuanchicus]